MIDIEVYVDGRCLNYTVHCVPRVGDTWSYRDLTEREHFGTVTNVHHVVSVTSVYLDNNVELYGLNKVQQELYDSLMQHNKQRQEVIVNMPTPSGVLPKP